MSYIKHTEFVYGKKAMLNVSYHAAGGAVVFDVSGRTQPCFLGHL